MLMSSKDEFSPFVGVSGLVESCGRFRDDMLRENSGKAVKSFVINLERNFMRNRVEQWMNHSDTRRQQTHISSQLDSACN